MAAVSAVLAAPPGNAQQDVQVFSRPTQRKRRIYLSHSARELFTTCGRKYRFSHVDRLETIHRSSNLGFGGAVHRGCEVFLIAQATGEVVEDPIEAFDRSWNDFCESHVVDYSSKWDREGLTAVGHRLIQKFMEDWIARGLYVVLDSMGVPVIERKLKIELPDEVIYTAIIDVLAMTPDGQILVIDLKTPAQVAFEGFTEQSEQLLGYQVVVDAHAEALGISQVDGRAFYELIKRPIPKTSRGEGPVIAPFHPVGRADDESIRDWIYETLAIANDIRAGRFPKRPGDAYNSPCSMCDMANFCLSSGADMTGVRKKQHYVPKDVAPVETHISGTIPF